LLLNPALGRLSDRLGRRRPTATLAAALQSVGLAALAVHPPFPVVLLVAATCMNAQVQPHLFALVDDYVGAGRAGLPRGATVASERAVVSAAWALGAPLGGVLLLLGRFAPLFAAAALLNAVAAVAIAAFCEEAPRAERAQRAARSRAPGAVPWTQLALYGASVTLITAGNAAKLQAVPLYLRGLGMGGPALGATYAWMAALEMVLMPPAGRLADRLPRQQVIALGALGGTAFFAAVALVPGTATVLLAFPAISFLIATVAGVGIGYAQDLDPERPGLAGGVYFAAQGIGVTAGGALIASAERTAGLPHAFLGPAVAIALGGVAVLATKPRRATRSLRLAWRALAPGSPR
jgi:MFS family permease